MATKKETIEWTLPSTADFSMHHETYKPIKSIVSIEKLCTKDNPYSGNKIPIDKHPMIPIERNIDIEEFRAVDNEAQNIADPYLLQYIITRLCDELIACHNDSPNGE